MKQTAVEFLLEKYKSQSGLLFAEDFEQAKSMENENAINFALQNVFGKIDVGVNLKNDYIKKYNETFKSE